MRPTKIAGIAAACVLLAAGAAGAFAQERSDAGRGDDHAHAAAPHAAPRGSASRGETYRGPTRYRAIKEPKGWNARPPATADRHVYQHNYRAPRSYRIGPYHRPPGWAPHHWAYGQILPRAYWTPNYLIGDYWLFSLQVPPAGYEWVRDGDDALLVSTDTGEILQVQYGVFA